MSAGPEARVRPFGSMSEAMDGPRSSFFGIADRPRNPESYYSKLDATYLSFDVSNNQILCSMTAGGLCEHACVMDRLAPRKADEKLVGTYVGKHVAAGGPWPFAVEPAGGSPITLHEAPGAGADLLGGLFSLFEYAVGPLRVRQLVLAPVDAGRPGVSPRAFLVIIETRNAGGEAAAGALVGPGEPGHSRSGEAVVCLDDPAWRADSRRAAFSLDAGESRVFSYAVALGRDADEVERAIQAVSRKTPLEWLNETWAYHAGRFGELSIPAEPFYAESFVRMAELCRQSVVHEADGGFGGSFWGSCFRGAEAWETPIVWVKDVFHAMLPMGMLEPRLCAGAALWFVEWGSPRAAFGRGLERFPDAGRVNHSLCNAVAAFQLAGEYYRSTGDRDFFLGRPELLAGAKEILGQVLASRRGEAMLFPSMYISDGDAKGDFHTGSNVAVWDALSKMARLAREVYGEQAPADEWAGAAARVREAILARCAGGHALGRRLFEGANADGTFVPGHDGEETDTTLMPFYGFCEQDDEALINHAGLALSEENPLYWPEMDGVWWTDDELFGATFPAWMTAVAGSRDEAELAGHLLRIRRLTDLDGSIWWWPYRVGDTDPTAPRREPKAMKSGWAAGVYLCLFVNNILGLRADVPARKVSFRPFSPWPRFTWTNCRLGAGRFDFSYRAEGGEMAAEITNRNAEPYDALVELTLPPAAAATSCLPAEVRRGRRYGRESVALSGALEPGKTLRLRVKFAAGL